MNNELNLWRFAARQLELKQPAMLLVVAESSGSSPGRHGFKMTVTRQEFCGSVGGGVMEIRLVEAARCKIQDSEFKVRAEIFEEIHRRKSPNSSGMICSGKQTVISFKLVPADLNLVRRIIRALENLQPEKKLQMTSENLRLIKTAADEPDFRFAKTGENDFIYEEKLGFRNKLFIVGGGHCALALSEIMSQMDFHISLFDDRENLNTITDNKFADRVIIIDSYENIGEFIDSGANVYVVVMTLGYKFDELVIRRLIDKKFKYFGVLGSRAKIKTLLRNLEKENFDAAKLKEIYAPVGLKINSRTPHEIAVSIAAEIIAVKNAPPERQA